MGLPLQGHKESGTVSQSIKGSASQAILVFLPGAGEIDRLARQLRGSPQLKRAAEGQGFLILPLHGSLPPDHQVGVLCMPAQLAFQLDCLPIDDWAMSS